MLQFILQHLNIHIDQERPSPPHLYNYVTHSLSVIRQGNSMPRESFHAAI